MRSADVVVRRAHWIRRALMVAAPLALALAAASCSKPPAHETRAEGESKAVRTFRVPAGATGRELTLAARVRAREEVTIPATVPGRVTALPVAEGRRFDAGDVLVRFAAPEAERALEAARAVERAASFHRDEARLQESRFDSLYRAHVASKRELEMAQSEARTAEAAYEGASAQRATLETGVAVPAPFAGVMGRHLVDAGATVQPGTPLVSIRSSGATEIEVAVPESQTDAVRGADAEFRVGGSAWYPARLTRIEGMIDPTSRTRVAFLSPQTRERFEPGAYARVRFLTASKPMAEGGAAATDASNGHGLSDGAALSVPASTLVRRGALTGLYLVEEGHARLRWVRLGHASNDMVEVLSGLWAGEDVVLDPRGLEDGQPVTVEP